MLLFMLLSLLIISASSLPAYRLLKKLRKTNGWDLILPFTGAPLWFVVAALTKIGSPASLSNFIVELFWVTVASCLTPWLILLLHKTRNHFCTRTARFLTLLPAAFAIALRLLMHTLPE